MLKIILKGECPIKKNGMGQLWFRKDKYGNKVPMERPIHYYTEKYTKWAKSCADQLIIYKHKLIKSGNVNILSQLPLTGTYAITFLMFMETHRRTDLSNLYEAPQDLLTGNIGVKLKAGITPEMYKLFADDNYKIMCNHGASACFYDPANPRIEIYISKFDYSKVGEMLKLMHPNLTQTITSDNLFNTVG